MELSGTTALVTGGARRVGRAISLALAEAGCDLVIHYGRSREDAVATAAEAESLGARVVLVSADLADPRAAQHVFDAAADLAPVQLLVNSASGFPQDSIHDVTPDGWDRTFAVTVRAPALLTQEFTRRLPGDAHGVVVSVTDWRTNRPYRDHFSYTVAKGALDTFTLAAAEALAPRIRVNAVALGAILPPPGEGSDYLKALAREIPVARVGGVEPVTDTVLFLARTHFVTGEIVRLDGGAHLR
jgi:glucose 1-dehydrogenase